MRPSFAKASEDKAWGVGLEAWGIGHGAWSTRVWAKVPLPGGVRGGLFQVPGSGYWVQDDGSVTKSNLINTFFYILFVILKNSILL